MKQNISKNIIITKEIKKNEKEIFQIIKESESINQYYKDNLKSFDINYLITQKNIKLLNFIFKYLFKSLKYKDFQVFFRLQNKKIICKQNPNKSYITPNTVAKAKYIIPKFIIFCLFNESKLSNYFNVNCFDNFLKIIKIFFLNDFINENDLQMILFIQIILCLYKNNEKFQNIQNVKQLYLVIDYLISFCQYNNHYMNDIKIKQFNNIINYTLDIINEHISLKTNFSNKYLLARSKSFYNLINLSKITTVKITYKIIKMLVNVYLYQLKIDYVFDDLSDQFLYKTQKESTIHKTNLLIAKNVFINDLLEREKLLLKKENLFIKNGFYFSDCPNNGIICDSLNKFPRDNDGYSIVVSFRLMNSNQNKENSKYTLFSLMNKENTLIHFYIEDNKLRLKAKKEKKVFDLYEINNNCNYVLWILQNKVKKNKMILYLNNCKNIINNIYYPDGYFKINLGFSNCNNPEYISKDNFVGVIGTFILFKKCLIKDENDNINITKLIELKGNYEDIIYVNTKREWGFIDKNINWILNRLSNDIDIYKDIEIIISTKSLGILELYDSTNILGDIKPEIYCNYFKNSSMKNEVKFYFRNKTTLENNLNFPVKFYNSFLHFLNNHIFLYLQLELYYFISLISLKISEFKKNGNNDIKNFKYFNNVTEEEDFYLNISKICSLFFFCIDSLNSITCLNNTQDNLFHKEIENFKYTLIDLITIYSKYNCKIKTYFLSLFVEKISEKKYFEYCLFILNIDFYDTKNSEEFDVLINYLNHISIEYMDNSQIKKLFVKIIEFDKIYLSDDIKKSTKKEYSKLMKNLIKIIIENELSECFKIYRKKLKKLKSNLEKNVIFNIEPDIEEEEYNNNDINKKSTKSCNDYCKNNDSDNNDDDNDDIKKKKISSRSLYIKEKEEESNNVNNNEVNNDEENIEILILIYKYLKNLYVGINQVKKKLVELWSDRINSITEYFNELFQILCKIYPIEADEQYLKYVSSEKDKKEIITAELIKCLCIRFLDDLFFEENLKKIKEEESKKKKGENDENDSKKGSSGNLKKSFNSCKTTIVTNSNMKSYNKREGSSSNLINLFNPSSSKQGSFISNTNTNINAYKTVERILISKMEFFDNIILSQYTFKSFYLMLFRDLSNDKKIKIIKNDKNIKKTLLLNDKNFLKTRYILRFIIFLFEKQNSDGFDTLFMSKIELIEYSYNIFINLFKNMLNNYLKSDVEGKKALKPMINSIFVDSKNSYNIHKFFNIMLDDIIENFNFHGCPENKLNYHDIISNYLDKLLAKIQNDITEFINLTLFELIDPFYFKLLIELFFENDKNDEYIINAIILIIEKIVSKMDKDNKNRIIEINSKNVLIFLYKMFFYVNKRSLILYTENELFLKKVILFLFQFIEHCNILYTKILFPIEEKRGKLLIEIVYEIIFEMYLDFLRNPKIESLQVSFYIFKDLFNKKKVKTNLIGKNNPKENNSSNNEDIEYTPFYFMDKIPYIAINNSSKEKFKLDDDIYISKEFYELKDYILNKYKDEIKDNKDLFSSCILFCIKIIISINDLEEYYKNNDNLSQSSITSSDSETNYTSKNSNEKSNSKISDLILNDIFINELKEQFINISKNILKMHVDLTSKNPFKSIGYYSKNIYEYIRSYIVDKVSFSEGEPNIKISELKRGVNQYKNEIKFFERVMYTKDGRTICYSDKKFNQILKSLKNDSTKDKDNESVGSFNDVRSRHSSEGKNSMPQSAKSSFAAHINNIDQGFSNSVKTFKKVNLYLNDDMAKSQNQIVLKKNLFNKSIFTKKSDNNNIYIYNTMIKLKKDLIRTYFSSYFKKLLTYDEDFINIKNIYNITFNKEIKDIDKYSILYPTKLKNYITNNYNKMFLKRDFNFFTDGYFKYSHNYLYNKKKYKYNYIFQNTLLFPEKKLMEENDSAHKEISNILNDLVIYQCEMLTVKGSIFGNIYVFDNCLLFKSDLENDRRLVEKGNEGNNLDFACCTIEYDHLKVEKTIIMEYSDIKEVVNRTFFYSWISLEIFLKDGKSYLFNLFNEETNADVFELLKQKKIPIIRKISEYFKKEEFSKKWKEGKIPTFDYLLLLNKYSSRTYNDPNQYPIMPWLFLEEGVEFIRNFDIPISVQNEETKNHYFSKKENFLSNDNSVVHGNHYSTSAYICFYLMRVNPFTNNMIKFQSNAFDIPDRQYSDMKQTIFLCQRMYNNREMIPELYSIPEIYINLNDNDFGKQKDGVRVHNIFFKPYCNNPFEFSYLIKNLINNNIEINNNINKWFDFIFGVNQLGNYTNNKSLSSQEKAKLKSLRRFNDYCYGQFYNLKKITNEAQKYNKSPKELYNNIKDTINVAINFGQCPYQLLNEMHPSKNISFNINDNCSTFSKNSSDYSLGDSNLNSRYNSTFSNKSSKENIIIKLNQKLDDIYKIKGGGDIIYFRKSSNNNYLYCLLSNRIFEIYIYDNKKNNFVLIKNIIPKCQFLFYKKTKNKNLIFKPKYLFCEINENIFICCRTLDKTLIIYNYSEDIEASFLLNSHTTCILNINNNEFITGHDKGLICKWKINYSPKNKKMELELLQLIKSNEKSIISLLYNEKLNIIITCDINTLMIRKAHNLEYLNCIDIKNKENYKKNIVDVKISDYNFIYILIYIEEKDSYELQGFTLNGIYFGKYSGNISNFDLTKSGRIIIGETNKVCIKVLHPVKLKEIYSKGINLKGENTFFHFYFEKPNLIYYGIKDKDSTRIKIISLDSDDEKYFT